MLQRMKAKTCLKVAFQARTQQVTNVSSRVHGLFTLLQAFLRPIPITFGLRTTYGLSNRLEKTLKIVKFSIFYFSETYIMSF